MRDGHIHSPYCPHGSNDSFEEYIERAIEVGLNEITFTEHLPLPKDFEQSEAISDSAMQVEELGKYIEDVKKLKEEYKDKIKINVGLEVDYLQGYEKYTKDMLDTIGAELDDAILSVHIIPVEEEYYCVDHNPNEFGELVNKLGGVGNVYYEYYKCMKNAIEADLGKYKPKRIGHLNLVRKFNQVFPYDYRGNQDLEEIVKLLKEKGYEVDYNVSGNRKQYCKEPYIDGYLLELVKKYNIPMVMGSDSHTAKDINNYKIIK